MSGFASAYAAVDNWIDSEYVIAVIIPALKKFKGESPTWRSAVMGLINQVIARNFLKAGPAMSELTFTSLKPIVAGLLLPLEELIIQGQKMRSEGFFRNFSKGTVASLIAGAIGPVVGSYITMGAAAKAS